MQLTRALSLLASGAGLLGVVLCTAGMIAIWMLGSRIDRASESIFVAVDKSLVVIGQRVALAQERVEKAKITSDEIRQGLKDWAQNETSQRVASRLKLDERTARLAAGLERADLWLETSEAAGRNVRQILELGASLGASIDVEAVDRLLERVAATRSKLAQAGEMVSEVRENVLRIGDQETDQDRLARVVEVIVRLVATLGEIDERLESSILRLDEVRAHAEQIKSRSRNWILGVTIVASILLVWMAAGQACMCRFGWRHRSQ